MVDWDPDPPPPGSVKHQRAIPFETPKLELMYGKKKRKILNFIQDLQQSESGEDLKSILKTWLFLKTEACSFFRLKKQKHLPSSIACMMQMPGFLP